jgi:hypothetical protein
MSRSFAPIPDEPYSTKILNQIRRMRSREPELTHAIEGRACPVCGAEPGQLCRRVKGMDAGQISYYHTARTGTELLVLPG